MLTFLYVTQWLSVFWQQWKQTWWWIPYHKHPDLQSVLNSPSSWKKKKNPPKKTETSDGLRIPTESNKYGTLRNVYQLLNITISKMIQRSKITAKAHLTSQCEAWPAEPWIDAAGVRHQWKVHFLLHETSPAERGEFQSLKRTARTSIPHSRTSE